MSETINFRIPQENEFSKVLQAIYDLFLLCKSSSDIFHT